MTHDHDHDEAGHDHPHPGKGDHPTHAWEKREAAIRGLLIEKGLVSAEEIRRKIEEWEQKTPADGARVVARAWSDPAYEARLLPMPMRRCWSSASIPARSSWWP
jgi:ABC-type Zn2+ transport system, periplasmic component/surface adhesin